MNKIRKWLSERPATTALAVAVLGGIAIGYLSRSDHAAKALGWYWFLGVCVGAGIIIRSER